MSKNDRAARRRAARAHGGNPPDLWGDYGLYLRIGIGVLVVVVLVGAGLAIRSRQSTQAQIDEYCAVYDQTHDEMVGAMSAATSTTAAPGTTVAPVPGSTVAPAPAEGTVPTGSIPTGSVPGSIPGTSTTISPVLDATARIKAVAEKRQAVGPANVRAAWADLLKVLNEAKPNASAQNTVQAARKTVADFAKNECGRDPADF